eukprot:scaffold44216_cov48-Phaeocystis_antarctica.AAC.2
MIHFRFTSSSPAPRTPADAAARARLSEPAKGKGQNAAIDASVRELAGVSRLGIVKKNRNKYE